MNLTLEELPTRNLVTNQGNFAPIVPLVIDYRSVENKWASTYGPFSATLWAFADFAFGSFQPGSGFRTDYFRHSNLFHQRLFAILNRILEDVDAETILEYCQLNNENITIRNILMHTCPTALMEGNRIRNLLEELERGKEPDFLTRALLPLAFMETTDLQLLLKNLQLELLPQNKETQDLLPIVLQKFLEGNSDLHSILAAASRPSQWRSHLSECGSHNLTLTCLDKRWDFCESGQIIPAVVVLLAILLPGFIQALANLIFYKVGECTFLLIFLVQQGRRVPLGFGLEVRPMIKNHPRLSWVLLVLATPFYLTYMMLIGPFLPMIR